MADATTVQTTRTPPAITALLIRTAGIALIAAAILFLALFISIRIDHPLLPDSILNTSSAPDINEAGTSSVRQHFVGGTSQQTGLAYASALGNRNPGYLFVITVQLVNGWLGFTAASRPKRSLGVIIGSCLTLVLFGVMFLPGTQFGIRVNYAFLLLSPILTVFMFVCAQMMYRYAPRGKERLPDNRLM